MFAYWMTQHSKDVNCSLIDLYTNTIFIKILISFCFVLFCIFQIGTNLKFIWKASNTHVLSGATYKAKMGGILYPILKPTI